MKVNCQYERQEVILLCQVKNIHLPFQTVYITSSPKNKKPALALTILLGKRLSYLQIV